MKIINSSAPEREFYSKIQNTDPKPRTMDNLPMLADLMIAEVIQVDINDNLQIVAQLFNNQSLQQIPVVKDDLFVGIINRDDFKQQLRKLNCNNPMEISSRLATFTAEQLLDRNCIKFNQADAIAEVSAILNMGLFTTVPIVDDQNRLVGMISQSDLQHLEVAALSKKRLRNFA